MCDLCSALRDIASEATLPDPAPEPRKIEELEAAFPTIDIALHLTHDTALVLLDAFRYLTRTAKDLKGEPHELITWFYEELSAEFIRSVKKTENYPGEWWQALHAAEEIMLAETTDLEKGLNELARALGYQINIVRVPSGVN